MRIIKEGKKPKTEWEITCSKCGCVFVYDSKDVWYDQRENSEWVHCPTCHNTFDVKDRENYE